MKKDRKTIFNYLSKQFIGRFTGFIIGLWASSLTAHFFTTRSIHNLWDLQPGKQWLANKPLAILNGLPLC